MRCWDYATLLFLQVYIASLSFTRRYGVRVKLVDELLHLTDINLTRFVLVEYLEHIAVLLQVDIEFTLARRLQTLAAGTVYASVDMSKDAEARSQSMQAAKRPWWFTEPT